MLHPQCLFHLPIPPELMKQTQYAPLNVAEMGLIIYAANEGHLQDIEVSKVLDFESALLAYANSEHADLMKDVAANGTWNDDIEATFKSAIEQFKATQTW